MTAYLWAAIGAVAAIIGEYTLMAGVPTKTYMWPAVIASIVINYSIFKIFIAGEGWLNGILMFSVGCAMLRLIVAMCSAQFKPTTFSTIAYGLMVVAMIIRKW